MTKLRLTKKERAAVRMIAGHRTDTSHLLYNLNHEGGYNFEELYTVEEVDRITSWIWKKLGLDD